MTEAELKEMFKEWEIQKFTGKEIVLYKEVDDVCNEHYILKEKDGNITIYKLDKNNNEIFFKNTEIAVEYLEEEESRAVKAFLREFIFKKGMVFEFFRRFEKFVPQLAYYDNQTFLEYRTESDYPMVLHYMLRTDGMGGDYRTEELKSCYPGVYTKNFSLFFGETMEYYISEKRGDSERLVANGSLRRSNVGMEKAGDRFHMINDYIIAVSLQDHEKAERVLENYYRTEFSTERLFTLL